MRIVSILFFVPTLMVSGSSFAYKSLPEGYSEWSYEQPCDEQCSDDRPVTHLSEQMWFFRKGINFCGYIIISYAPRGKVATGRIAGHKGKDGRLTFEFSDDFGTKGSFGFAELMVQNEFLSVTEHSGTDGYIAFPDEPPNYFKRNRGPSIFSGNFFKSIIRSCKEKIGSTIDFLKEEK